MFKHFIFHIKSGFYLLENFLCIFTFVNEEPTLYCKLEHCVLKFCLLIFYDFEVLAMETVELKEAINQMLARVERIREWL